MLVEEVISLATCNSVVIIANIIIKKDIIIIVVLIIYLHWSINIAYFKLCVFALQPTMLHRVLVTILFCEMVSNDYYRPQTKFGTRYYFHTCSRLFTETSLPGEVCPWRSLSRRRLCLGVCVQEVSVQKGVSVQSGVSVRETPRQRRPPYSEEQAVHILLERFLVVIYLRILLNQRPCHRY